MKSDITTGGVTRIAPLDGLRGLAAAAVVLYHCMLASPTIYTGQPGPDGAQPPAWEWWAARTPLHLLWVGPEAVVVFFVLSGFVLTLPFMSGPHSWQAYYARRLIRLFLPVWASVVLAAALIAAVPRVPSVLQSEFAHDRAVHLTLFGTLSDGSLWSAKEGVLNAPLWSLHYELLFSLLLPLYLAVVLALRRWSAGTAALLLALIAVGVATHVDALTYMPTFGIGVLIAVERERIHPWALARPPWQWGVLFGTAGLLLMIHWLGLHGDFLAATVGAAILVVGFQYCASAARISETKPVQWLGRRSFSLYLVHEPIVVTAIFVTHATAPAVPMLIAIPCSLAATVVMYALVERPAQRLARRVGHRIENRLLTQGAAKTSPACPADTGEPTTAARTRPPTWDSATARRRPTGTT